MLYSATDDAMIPCYYSTDGNSDVQCGHLEASTAISLLQNGHNFVVGADGASFVLLPSDIILFTALTMMKMIKAMITK